MSNASLNLFLQLLWNLAAFNNFIIFIMRFIKNAICERSKLRLEASFRIKTVSFLLIKIYLICFSLELYSQIWNNIGPIESNQPSLTSIGYVPSLEISPTGHPFLLFSGDEGVKVRKYEFNQWSYVGNSSISPVSGGYLDLKFNSVGTPYIIFRENSAPNSYFISVKKLNADTWEYVGSGQIAVSGEPYYATLSIDKNNVPYFFCWVYNYSSNVASLTIKKFNGTNWVDLPNPNLSPIYQRVISIGIDSDNTPFISFGAAGAYNIMSF